ncbi:carbon-nitrogen family hydrolase [Roseibacillus ishigakijimensis]|uniref:Carbon-nitrogen family hydrolase n=1 Tax=Roseibacillus ishigakijimensis TaxID=454146 RepID=A0A934VIW0_9BACT|nr:carbon-nitrogen family hydrolase [Roseibacillus ishigakijimensis]MBK1835488.1 carbon-nitrogen family hydrolase [Roseibacillus ishigakijimensis]
MRVYCCQLDPVWEKRDHNLARLSERLAEEKPEPGSLIVLPEMFATGFSMDFATLAEPADHSPTLTFLATEACRHRCAILAGLVLEREGLLSNEAALITAQGEIQGSYQKIHPFSPSGEEKVATPGSWVKTFPLGDWRLAPLICYDLRFPEVFRLAAPEAELFIVIANWPTPRVDHWRTLLRARAIENQSYVVGVNRVGSDPNMDFPGHSLIIDPQGQILAEGNEQAGIITAELDRAALHQWRDTFPAHRDRRLDLHQGTLASRRFQSPALSKNHLPNPENPR